MTQYIVIVHTTDREGFSHDHTALVNGPANAGLSALYDTVSRGLHIDPTAERFDSIEVISEFAVLTVGA